MRSILAAIAAVLVLSFTAAPAATSSVPPCPSFTYTLGLDDWYIEYTDSSGNQRFNIYPNTFADPDSAAADAWIAYQRSLLVSDHGAANVGPIREIDDHQNAVTESTEGCEDGCNSTVTIRAFERTSELGGTWQDITYAVPDGEDCDEILMFFWAQTQWSGEFFGTECRWAALKDFTFNDDCDD